MTEEPGLASRNAPPERLVEILHARLRSSAYERHASGYFKDAAREAMTEVELVLKEKALAPRDLCGGRLVDYAFGKKGGVLLHVPFGPGMQNQARALFRATFQYYRNYAVHDGRKIDAPISARILALASELLELLDSSPRSLRIEGGPEGLVGHGHFESITDFARFLEFMDGQWFPNDTWDGLMEDLAHAGFSWDQITLLEELGLLSERTESGQQEVSAAQVSGGMFEWHTFFELTESGKKTLRSLRRHEGDA